MKTYILALVALTAAAAGPGLSFAQAGASGQGSDTVIELRVYGNEHLSDEAVLTHSRTRIGEPFDAQTVKADEQRMLRTGRFDSVVARKRQTPEGIIITFVVAERTRVSAVEFVGNKAVSDSELAKEISFGEHDPLSIHTVEGGRQTILQLYIAKGYHFAKVELDREAFAQQRVIYRIVEGPLVRIRKILVVGNEFFSRWQINRRIGSSSRFWPIISGLLDAEQVKRDVLGLRDLYVAEGFLDCEVARQLEFSEDKSSVVLTFVISEGRRYRVDKLIFDGNNVFADEQLTSMVNLKQGEFYSSPVQQRDVRKISDVYGELGYIEARVTVRKQYLSPEAPAPKWAKDLPKPALLNLIYTISEQNKFEVGRVIIRGNKQTQSHVIRRELKVYPGQLFNMVALKESNRRLRETQLFENVSVEPVGDAPNVRDVLAEVTEGDTANLIVGASVSSGYGLLGNISLVQRNFDLMGWPRSWRDVADGRAFKGAGQTLRLVFEPGTNVSRFHLSIFEPALFDRPVSLGAKVYLWARGLESYDETRVGGVFSLGHRFKNRWYGEASFRIESIEVGNLTEPAPLEVSAVEGTNPLLAAKGMVVRNRTDSRWMPSTGDRLTLSYEQAFSEFAFGTTIADYRIYRTLHRDAFDRPHILAGRVKVGNIIGEAPVFERFYAGGIGSIRGFNNRGVGPRSSLTNDPIGGDFLFFAGTEYSFPMVTDIIRGVVFLDTGTVDDEIGVSTYRASIGAGVRWIIPLFGPVPLTLDFGIPIKKDDNDETQVFSFSIGWSF